MISLRKKHDGPKVRIHWFGSWNSDLDAALEALPEQDTCPRDLYRILCKNQDSSLKCYALIERESEVIAVVGLRKRINDWVPVTHYTIPGMIFPVTDGCVGEALSAINKNLRVAWWRMGEFSEYIPNLRHLEVLPTFQIDLLGDYEGYWRKSGMFSEVKRQRKRCGGFEVSINANGMAEWTIRNWELKWRKDPANKRPDLEDKVIAAQYLQAVNKYTVITILDKEKPIAGITHFVQGNYLVAHYIYREPGYDKFGTGNYLMDISAKWAVENGFSGIDLGGEYPEHKKRWGPTLETKTSLHICPIYLDLWVRCKEIIQAAKTKGIE